MKRCLSSSFIGGNVNKTTNEIYTRRLAKNKILTIPKVDKDVEELELSYIAYGNVYGTAILENSLAGS